jgi:hypothetical protein
MLIPVGLPVSLVRPTFGAERRRRGATLGARRAERSEATGPDSGLGKVETCGAGGSGPVGITDIEDR